jgi:predicted branched-subunit amino acid permease
MSTSNPRPRASGFTTAVYGFPWWLAAVISAVMFAGSVEFILVGMLAVAAPIATIAMTTFLVNSRHLFYGLSFPLHRVDGWHRKAYSVFALCDEAYALTTSKDPETLTSGRSCGRRSGCMHPGPAAPSPAAWSARPCSAASRASTSCSPPCS